MADIVFNRALYYIEGDDIELHLIGTYKAEDSVSPFYCWDIILKSNNVDVGNISFRIGKNYHSAYNDSIGYEVDEEYKGYHYALLACQAVLKVVQYHKMEKINLTYDYDNVASYKTIEKTWSKIGRRSITFQGLLILLRWN